MNELWITWQLTVEIFDQLLTEIMMTNVNI